MKRIKIFDTTLRDGEQSPGCSMNLPEKIEMAKQLEKLGVDIIEAGFAIASPMDHKSVQAIAGAVIGGTSMTGGKTNVAMTFVGVMFVVCLQNGLNMIAVPAFYQHVVTGVVLVLAIVVQTDRKK